MKRFISAVIFLALALSLISYHVSAQTNEPESPGGDVKEQPAKKKEVKKKIKLPPIKMIFVKGDCFNMGDFTGEGDDDERPVHEVCLADYYLAQTEVTNELWFAVMEFYPTKDHDPKEPVKGVSWSWANRFIEALNKRTDGFYRMPTEAEWEFAARERGKRIRWSGTNNDEDLEDYAWFGYNSGEKLHNVKQKKPNELGLYDMTGNVWEWVEDNFDFDYYKTSGKDDPYGPDFSRWRTVRGGSFLSLPEKSRTTYRRGIEPIVRSEEIGLRIAE
ncbi:MAG: formylglycine-generating enzyme family protein [Thermodesulfobacteriota bacterium]